MSQKSILVLQFIVALFQIAHSHCPYPEPDCSEGYARNTLFPHKNDPHKFWQCVPKLTPLQINDVWSFPVERNCAPGGTKFSYKWQVCVW